MQCVCRTDHALRSPATLRDKENLPTQKAYALFFMGQMSRSNVCWASAISKMPPIALFVAVVRLGQRRRFGRYTAGPANHAAMHKDRVDPLPKKVYHLFDSFSVGMNSSMARSLSRITTAVSTCT